VKEKDSLDAKRGYTPREPPTSKPSKLTIQEIGQVKELFEDSKLAKYIKMAGITGVILASIEVGRLIVEAIRWYSTLPPAR
jgi:hypothetical protein